MNSKPLNLVLLFRQLATVHMNIDPDLVGEDVKHIEPLMIRNITLWLLPVNGLEERRTLEYKLCNLVQLMELNEVRKQLNVEEGAATPATAIPHPSQYGLHLLKAITNVMIFQVNEHTDYAFDASQRYINKEIQDLLALLADQLGGMAIVVRTQVILCAWKVVNKTHPIVKTQTQDMTPPDVIRLLPDVITDLPLREDVPAMIAEVGEGLIQRLGLAEKV